MMTLLPHVCDSNPSPALSSPDCPALPTVGHYPSSPADCQESLTTHTILWDSAHLPQLTAMQRQAASRLIISLNPHRRFLALGHKVCLRILLPAGHKLSPSLATLSGSRWLHGTQAIRNLFHSQTHGHTMENLSPKPKPPHAK